LHLLRSEFPAGLARMDGHAEEGAGARVPAAAGFGTGVRRADARASGRPAMAAGLLARRAQAFFASGFSPRVTYTMTPSVASSMKASLYPSSFSSQRKLLPSLALPTTPSLFSRAKLRALSSVFSSI